MWSCVSPLTVKITMVTIEQNLFFHAPGKFDKNRFLSDDEGDLRNERRLIPAGNGSRFLS